MDWKRVAKKNLIPFYNVKDLASKIQDYGFVDGVKSKLKEDLIEDMPIIGNVYDHAKEEGRYLGKHEGYEQASYEYEKKLLNQGEQFLKQAKKFERDKDSYEKLIDDYEVYIHEIEHKNNLSNQERDYMNQIMIMERKLIELNNKDDSYSSNITSELDLRELDERGFIKNTAKHRNGTKYDDEGYDKFGYDKDGYNKNGLDKFGRVKKVIDILPECDERGFIKNTAKHKNGTKYDDEGYDKFGYDKKGYNKNGLDKFGKPGEL